MNPSLQCQSAALHFVALAALARKTLLPCLLLFSASLAVAQSGAAYPSRPVKFIIQYTAGGLGDTVARALAQHLSERTGQPFLIENRPGANGVIAMEALAKAPNDGYTVGMATQTGLVMNAAVRKKLPFDPIKDFTPVSLVFRSPLYLVLHPSVKANTVAELIALARREPGKLTYASIGVGSIQHLAGERFKQLAGIDLLHVPYKGSGPALTDLLAGQVSMMFEGATSGLGPVKAGKLRALASTTNTRTSASPELPTMREAGVANFDISSWFGFAVPAGTARPIVDRLNAELRLMLSSPATAQKMLAAGIDLTPSTPEEMAERIRIDLPLWAKIVRDAGIEPE
jgi:tripartite-type tricarboxylate transporter receptor subunit TctC